MTARHASTAIDDWLAMGRSPIGMGNRFNRLWIRLKASYFPG
jgi:hypothetical protein